MLAGAKREAIAQFFGHIEANGIGFARLGNDLGDAQRMKMLGHGAGYQVASG